VKRKISSRTIRAVFILEKARGKIEDLSENDFDMIEEYLE
jgi:hypothetical protein